MMPCNDLRVSSLAFNQLLGTIHLPRLGANAL